MRLEDIQKAFLRGISKRNVESTKLLIDLLWAADPDIVATLGLSEIIIQRISELSDNHLIVIKALLEEQQPHPIEKAQSPKPVSYTHLRAPRDRQKTRMPSSA